MNFCFSIFELCCEFMRTMLFFQVITSALYTSCSHFVLETVRKSSLCFIISRIKLLLISFQFQLIKSMDIRVFVIIFSTLTSIFFIFLYCAVGSFVTNQFLRYADITYESIWYEFPIDLQKYLVLIIADAQRPKVFDGLGIIDLNLMTFIKVRDPCYLILWLL